MTNLIWPINNFLHFLLADEEATDLTGTVKQSARIVFDDEELTSNNNKKAVEDGVQQGDKVEGILCF